MKGFHLAQLNIAVARAAMDSNMMQGFSSRLDEINVVADKASGFVWRLQTEDGDATGIHAFDDPLVLVNMSVWEDLESLKNFVYKSMHIELIRNRDAWFLKMVKMHQVLWWVPVGQIPTLKEAKSRLELLRENGPGPKAFTFANPY